MIEKVGIYCRLSDEDRDKINKNDDSDSIVNQRSMCLKYANQNGFIRMMTFQEQVLIDLILKD